LIALHLPENATTGYRWAMTSLDEARFAVEDTGYRAQGGAVGSGGEAYWKLRARFAGKGHIELANRRDWEGDRSIIDHFAIDADIQPE
jgi:inhibitor of cysteine peptidase